MTRIEEMSVRLGMACYTASDRIAGRSKRKDKSLKFGFDENDDLMLEDIPDDLMELAAKQAFFRSITVEDVWRDILTLWSKERPT